MVFSLLLGVVPSVIGLFTSFVPNLIKYLENKQKFQHEVTLEKLKMEALEKGLAYESASRAIEAVVEEGESVRRHDSSISSSSWINDVRALVRPVITYSFFALFVFVKMAAAIVLFRTGHDPITILNAIWDPYTVALFGTIMSFWFGSRTMMHINKHKGDNS